MARVTGVGGVFLGARTRRLSPLGTRSTSESETGDYGAIFRWTDEVPRERA